ncbi:MAG: hypothetical protein JNK11_14550, partial [Alphaproteobacteria bacterium]|nr:hypothetical protein [Alphaproteobacteria bacterium]
MANLLSYFEPIVADVLRKQAEMSGGRGSTGAVLAEAGARLLAAQDAARADGKPAAEVKDACLAIVGW